MNKITLLFALVGTLAYGNATRIGVFDIDDTLVDTNFRTLEALHDVGRELGLNPLLLLEYPQVDFYCSTTCKNAGLTEAALIEKICGNPKQKGALERSLWGLRFLGSDAYLRFDHVISGASRFIVAFREETASSSVFLTGRSEDRRKVTEEQLRYFDLWDGNSQLIMKKKGEPDDDTVFKQNIVDKLKKDGHVIVAAFDDSLKNANMFRKTLAPKIPVVRPMRDTAQTKGMETGITPITNYYFNASSEGGKRSLSPNSELLKSILNQASSVTE